MKTPMTPEECRGQLPGWHSVQKPDEFVECLKRAIAIGARRVIEIGVYMGGTLRAWQAVLPENSLIVAIDRSFNPYDHRTELPTHLSTETIMIESDSQDPNTLRQVSQLLPDGADVLWIDGGHAYDEVKADFDNYREFVRRGGLIAFHDIAECPTQPWVGVRKFWLELRKEHPDWQFEEIIREPLGWGGIGIITV